MKVWFLLTFLLINYQSIGQNLNGQWRGTFNSANNNIVSGEGDTEYILELFINDNKVTGYSYSYFNYPEKRYYVICRLEGNYDAGSKSIIVNEEERVKGNTPPTWGDCLQTHILTYLKQGGTEKLIGRWRGYQPSGCGAGSTELERKSLSTTQQKTSSPVTRPKPPSTTKSKINPPANSNQNSLTVPPVTKKAEAPSSAEKQKSKNPVLSKTEKNEEKPHKPQKVDDANRSGLPKINTSVLPGYVNRSKNILKTIEVPANEKLKIDFYDNGEIDGDTISVFYNNKLLLSRQRLTDKPLSLTIQLDTTRTENELVMYADNLGSIPPNTALMIVTVGDKRHEVYITSTEKSSGTVRFKRKE